MTFEVKGKNGQIVLENNRIIIKRKGLLAFFTQGLKGEKTIPIKNITSIQYKGAGITSGYIQFSIMGSLESKAGLNSAVKDENTVMFSKNNESDFLILKEYIENYDENNGKSLENYLAEKSIPSSESLNFTQADFSLTKIIDYINKNMPLMKVFRIDQIQDINKLILRKTNKWGRFAIVMAMILIVFLNFSDFEKSNKAANIKSTEASKADVKPATPPLLQATPGLIENLKFVLNDGYKIVDSRKVYCTKSLSFDNAYFIGALIRRGGDIYPCIWISTSKNMDSYAEAANEYAILVSSMPDATKSDMKVSRADDGYFRVSDKILADMNNVIK